MKTILHEPKYVSELYSEYLKTYSYYLNLKRSGVYIKYYNIDMQDSIYNKSNITYDNFTLSKISYNIYETTPVLNVSEVQNTLESTDNITTQFLNAQLSITIFTISKPKINDLVIFYSPIENKEIFRVKSFSVQVNALNSSVKLPVYSLELIYAPILENNIKVTNKFIYDTASEKYLPYNEYITMINNYNKLDELLTSSHKYYSSKYDMYMFKNIYVPIFLNELILIIKSKNSEKLNNILENHNNPFGYVDIFGIKYQTLNDFPKNIFTQSEYPVKELSEIYKITDSIRKLYIKNCVKINNNTYNPIFELERELYLLLINFYS